jgi:tight adherence protein B
MEEVFPILVAVTVACFTWGVASLLIGMRKGERQRLAERLSGASGSAGARQYSARGSGIGSALFAQAAEDGLPRWLARFAVIRAAQRHLVHSFPDTSFVKFLGLSAGVAGGSLVGAMLVWDSAVLALAVGALAGAAPFMAVVRRRNRRQRQLTEQLPEALDFLQRILRAGHSLSTGLSMMGDELPQPLGGEFRRCYDQHSLGQSLEEALRDMARRIESTDFAFFVTAVLIQRQTGGDLSQVLGNISGMLRQRIRLGQYVKAKTAEGRFTGYVLVAFPVLMFFIASGMNAEYKKNLLETSSGLTMLGVAAGLVVLGLVTIRKITTVKV